ncbi:MAG: protein kinase [Sandaracinaceae bacterium]
MATPAPTPRSSASRSGYRALFMLGSGGMGEVHLAARRDGERTRLYALKRIREEHRHDRMLRAMFLDEARLAGLVRDPHVVRVFEAGEDEQGVFLAMEYVEGASLADLLVEHGAVGSLIPLATAIAIGAQAARGLHAAHTARDLDGRPLELVHRDVSPHNILVGLDGLVRVADFGIAKGYGRSTKTITGVIKGKLAYLAPEQLRFEPPDARTDLFAFGIVLFEMLTGQRLYLAEDDVDVRSHILNVPAPRITGARPDAPAALADLVDALLAKEREDRPSDARAVAEALERMQADLAPSIGGADIEGCVDTWFGDDIRAKRERAQRALREVRRDATPSETRRASEGAAPSAAAALAPPTSAGSPPPRTARRMGVVVALSILVVFVTAASAVGTVEWLTQEDEPTPVLGSTPRPSPPGARPEVPPTNGPLPMQPLTPQTTSSEGPDAHPTDAHPLEPPTSEALPPVAPVPVEPQTSSHESSSAHGSTPHVVFRGITSAELPDRRAMQRFLARGRPALERCLIRQGQSGAPFAFWVVFESGRSRWLTVDPIPGADPREVGPCGVIAYRDRTIDGGGSGRLYTRGEWSPR